MTEPNPKYWPPPVTGTLQSLYVEQYRVTGKYPPKLSADEKSIVDKDGSYDRKGNKHAVVWLLGGYPTAAKIDKKGDQYFGFGSVI